MNECILESRLLVDLRLPVDGVGFLRLGRRKRGVSLLRCRRINTTTPVTQPAYRVRIFAVDLNRLVRLCRQQAAVTLVKSHGKDARLGVQRACCVGGECIQSRHKHHHHPFHCHRRRLPACKPTGLRRRLHLLEAIARLVVPKVEAAVVGA